jgi:CRISPR-associated protein (TIGR02710 family)
MTIKKAMIITIGTGSGVDNGIAFSVRQQNPDLLCFIYSKESEKTLEAVLTKLSKKREDVLLKQFDEINDVEKIYQEYSKYIDQILSKGYSPNEVVADYTSGTKSMSSALVSSAIAKEIGVLSYVYGARRDEQGRVISNTERVSSLSPNAIFTEQKIKLFKQLFNRYQFDSACKLIDSTTIHYDFKDLTGFYLQLSKAYAEWDRFNFKQSSEQLNSLDLKIATPELKELVENHKTKLHKLKQANEKEKLSEDDLTDLFSNALRRFEEGKYDDCVARLYRLVEMVAQIEFEKEFQMTTDKVKIDILPDSLKKKFTTGTQNSETTKLALLDTFEVLNEKSESKRTKTFFNKQDDFLKLLFARNHSRLAHGQRPITKETCEKLRSFVQEVFEIKDITDFPKLE